MAFLDPPAIVCRAWHPDRDLEGDELELWCQLLGPHRPVLRTPRVEDGDLRGVTTPGAVKLHRRLDLRPPPREGLDDRLETPRISAEPFATGVHSTPSDRVSSSRTAAW